MKKLVLITFLFVLNSCNSTSDFKVEKYKEEYNDAVNCLYKNYALLLPDSIKGTVISLYPNDLETSKACENVLELLNKRSIEFVMCYKDSTIAFYSKTTGGFKTKQYILIFTNDNKKIGPKINNAYELVGIKDKVWYEYYRILSLAD